MRIAAFIIALILLTSCTIDPCSIDGSSPTCETRRSEARATIGAIDADAALRATQSAIYLGDQTTKAAISANATRQVVKAEATQAAMNTEATRQAIGAAATQSAVVYRSTQTFVDAEATKIAVNVSGVIERARIEREAMPASSIFNVLVFWFLIPAACVLALIVYGRRTVQRTTEAFTQSLHRSAAMITYGPPNNPQLAFVTFDPRTGQPNRLLTTEGLIGNHLELSSGDTMINRLNVDDPMKLAALIESAKRTQAARIASATNSAPWSVVTMEQPQVTSAVPEQIGPGASALPRIPTFAELLQTWRPSVQQMLFGFGEDGRPIYGSLDQLLSALVVGRQGQGKTTLLRLIDLQCALTGVRVLAWDIHDDIAEDVPGIQSYTRPEEIEQSAIEINNELDRRVRLKLKGDKARPIMVLIDEVNTLADRVPELSDIIKRIVSEGRKYRIFEFITAKGAPAELFEKSWARDSFSALFAFWTSALQARNAGFEADAARRVESLTPGRALLRLQTAPPQVVTFPDLPIGDMQRLLAGAAGHAMAGAAGHAMSASGAASSATSEPLPETSFAASGEAEKAAEVDYFDGVEAAGKREEVRRMIKQGSSQREIIATLWGVTGGNAYREASQELNAIVAEMIK